MNRLSTSGRAAVVSALVEGNSIRATCRITGRDKETVMRLLDDVGAACDVYQGGALRNLPCKRIECDEIWSFVGCKAKNVSEKRQNEYFWATCSASWSLFSRRWFVLSFGGEIGSLKT